MTGCDTGVGKTHVGCSLAALAVLRGMRVRVYKPVESGCDPHPADARRLAECARDDRPLDAICPVQLRAPISPHDAARLEHRTIDPDALVRGVPADGDLVLVEGAGGLLTPLTDDLLMADLAVRMRLPVLIVIDDRLGAINRALLTVEAANARGLSIAAVVLNPTSAAPAPSHAAAIASFTKARLLGPLSYGASSELLLPLLTDAPL